jgi:hypothetical protein
VQKKQNPMFLALGVCGGCALLAILLIGVVGVLGYNKSKGVINGAMNMANNMPMFLTQLQAKNYEGAASLVNKQQAPELTAEKIQKIEENVEKKLGPLMNFPPKPESEEHSSSASTDGNTGKVGTPSLSYTWRYRLTYKKGTATAIFKFYEPDILHMQGKVTGFEIVPDDASESGATKKGAHKGKPEASND